MTAFIGENPIHIQTSNSLKVTGVISIGSRRFFGSNYALSVETSHSRSSGKRIGYNAIHTLNVIIGESVLDNLAVVGYTLGSGEGTRSNRAGGVQDESIIEAFETL